MVFRIITDWLSYLAVNGFKELGNSAHRKIFYGLCYKNIK